MRWSVLALAAVAALLVPASPASAQGSGTVHKPIVINDPPGTDYSGTWNAPILAPRGKAVPNWAGGVCRGSFTNLIQNVGSVQFGAYWQCTSSVDTTVQVFVQECDPIAGGKFYCFLENESRGNLAHNVAYFNRSDAYFGCQPPQTKYFRPVARFLSVQGVSVANKYGTPVLGTC